MTRDFKDKKCGNCVFFDGVKGTAIMIGVCRRFPPTQSGVHSKTTQYPQRGGMSGACAEFDIESG